MAKKQQLTAADKLEESLRTAALEGEIATLISDLQKIENNRDWCGTKEGADYTMKEHAYTEEELSVVLEKQEANRRRLRAKADLLKGIYNKRLNT